MTGPRFAPIGLAELNELAALQTRIDRKYVVSTATAASLADWLDPRTRVLTISGESAQQYRSIYFDTPDYHSYHLAAQRRRRRFKVRTRAYCETNMAFLEVKTRGGRGVTRKERIPHPVLELDTLTRPAREHVATILRGTGAAPEHSSRLEPKLIVAYERTTLLLPPSGSGGATRVTVDTHLNWQFLGADQSGPHLDHPDLAIVETKTGSGVGPADRLLWRRGIRPARFSKYATGLAALRPDLPANRWSRTIRRTMAPYTLTT